MAFEDLLDHKCDIYHIRKSDSSPGFGLPASLTFDYKEEPDEKEVICHFGVESLDTGMEQKKPQNLLSERIKLTLPAGTDVRINDRIVNRENGMEYTAELPRNIRNHHIFVYVRRISEQEAL